MASYISQLPSFFFLLSAAIQAALNIHVSTPPRVTVPLGGNVTIPCMVDDELELIYWNRGSNQSSSEIVVARQGSEPPVGMGLDSGDFNITVNNSLVINHMRLEYEHSYICIALSSNTFKDDTSVTEVIATVKPTAAPTIKFSCDAGPCGPQLEEGDFVNLTCSSDEARPAVTLTWTDGDGIPIQGIFNDTQDGSQLGTFVTSSTIQYNFKRATTLTCQADGDAVGQDSSEHRARIDLSLKTTEAPYLGTGTPGTKPPNSRLDNYNGEEEEGGLDLVTILMVAVAVSVLVVIILIVAVVVLYKKNQESEFLQHPESCMMKNVVQ